MAHCLLNSQSDSATNPPNSELEAFKEENARLKQHIKSFEGEHLSMKAFFEQKIEFLEDKIASYEEREENIKRTNQIIMSVLEDLGKEDGKNGLKIKAIEELEKANQQYSQSLFERKIRMKEEIAKLEIENKKLQEDSSEKDYKLKILRQFIEDIREGYINMRPTFIINSQSSPQKGSKEWEEGVFQRRMTLPEYSTKDDLWEKLGFGRDKRGKGRGEGEDLLIIEEEDNIFARSISQPLETAASEPKIQYLNKITSSKSDLQPDLYKNGKENMSEEKKPSKGSAQSDHITSLGRLCSNAATPREEEITKLPGSSADNRDTKVSLTEHVHEQKVQVPKHMFSVSTLTLNSDMMKAMANEQEALCETLDPHIFEDRAMFSDRKETNPREKLVIKDFWTSKNMSTEQRFCLPRNTENSSSPREILNIEDYDEDQMNPFKQTERPSVSNTSYQYADHIPVFYDDNEDIMQQKLTPSRHSYMTNYFGNDKATPSRHSYMTNYAGNGIGTRNPSYNLSRHVRSRNISGRLNFVGGEDDDNLQSETRFMMSRLLKVKRKLDKKSIELNASIAQGWEQSQLNTSGLTKKSISEPYQGRRGSRLNETQVKNHDLMGHAVMTDTRFQNAHTPRQMASNNVWSGPKEDFYLKKNYR